MFLSMTKMERSPKTGRRANRSELCVTARDESTVNTAPRKETDMMEYTRYEKTWRNALELVLGEV